MTPSAHCPMRQFRCAWPSSSLAQREYDMTLVSAQDSMAWETQGPLTDRTREHLGIEDEGVIELRKMLREQIDRVQHGLEPLGVIRDPAKNRLIDLGVFNERIGLYVASETRMTQSRAAS